MARPPDNFNAKDRSCEHAPDVEVELATTRADLSAARKELETLYGALDHVRSGLLILDGDLRARYSNPALHTMFGSLSAEQIRDTRPLYADMLRNTSAVDLSDYVAQRVAWVTSGDPEPMDLPLIDGTVLRCHLATLSGGGRMLIYSDVTDIFRNAAVMEQLATIDGMTGIYNRRHFLTLADREWDRAGRYGRPLSFLMIDIDFFKAINDRFGHDVGDLAIVHVAELARACKRPSDVLARIGGEEFALLLPETNLQGAQFVAERLRCEVAKCPLAEVAGFTTVSIGVATAGSEMKKLPDLMKAADEALFAAKRAGRNRVICTLGPNTAPPISTDESGRGPRTLAPSIADDHDAPCLGTMPRAPVVR